MDATVNYLLENKKSFILELSDSTCNAETDLNKLNDASVLSDLETGSHSHSLILSRPHSPTLSAIVHLPPLPAVHALAARLAGAE